MSAPQGSLQDAIQSLLATVLGVDPRPGEIRRAECAQWDSLKHVEIVFALEDLYGIQFDESEFPRLDSASSIAALVESRLAA